VANRLDVERAAGLARETM